MRVIVVDHDPEWPGRYAAEAERLREVLGGNLAAIHHIGSTSVPGLAAKPVIDIMAVVQDLGAVDAANAAMEALGYECMGEFGIPGRRYFRRGGDRRTHQVHVFQADDTVNVSRHLAFRDYLRAHSDEAARYGRLKAELARRHPQDIEAYMDGKDAMVKEMELRALGWAGGPAIPASPPTGRAERPPDPPC